MIGLLNLVVSIATLLALIWYAWETRKIRLDAAKQNELLSQQIELTRQMFKFETEKQISTSEPVFHWQGGGTGGRPNEFVWNFKNTGSGIAELSAESELGQPLDISPRSGVEAGAGGQITLPTQVRGSGSKSATQPG